MTDFDDEIQRPAGRPLPVEWDEIGVCRIAHGDCMEAMSDLERESVSCVIADPPYCTGGATRTDRKASTSTKYQTYGFDKFVDYEGDQRDERSFMAWSILWMRHASRVMRMGASILVFSDWRQLANTCDALQIAGFVFRGIVVWAKPQTRPQPNSFRADCEYIVWATKGDIDRHPSPDAKYLPGFYEFSAPSTAQRYHMNQKPYELIEALMEICPRGGVVLDPFMGSGTSGLAALRTGRPFVGIELSDHYYSVARERLAGEEQQGRLFTEETMGGAAEQPTLDL